ncbi:hypothetical protein BR93DRAFT_968628 [Coniochaeta sp. PMI_546]|nr:hypothetical protein BR93DRAFT_968628 [Coniochaeta sp. PMI_546]
MRSIYFSSAVLSTTVQALAFWAPTETFVPTIVADSVSPRPTLPPSIRGLRKRQTSSSDTFLIGPDQTCGFISGLPGAGFACDAATDSCVLVPATSATPGFVGCCDDQDCGFRVTCLDYNEVSSSSLCDNGCMVDTFTVKCTASTEQFCNTISFPGDIYDFFCNSLSISTPQLAFTTYNGETDGRAFITTVFGDSSSESDLPTTSTRNRQSTSSKDSSSSTTSTSPTSTSSGSSSATGTNGNAASSTPIGPIVGGVVGGVAVIGLIALGVVFILRRKTSSASAAPQPGFPSVPPGQPPSTPGTHQSFYVPPPGDPAKHNSTVMVNGQPMTQTYPTPPPPFPAQPYPAPPPEMQAGYYQAAGGTTQPLSAGEYNHPGTAAPVSPSTTMASHPSYQPGFGQGRPGQVHEIGDGGHRGTMSELS